MKSERKYFVRRRPDLFDSLLFVDGCLIDNDNIFSIRILIFAVFTYTVVKRTSKLTIG